MTSTRGRIDKREAILDAAFAVFSRVGYDAANVQEIAAEAGVAKPTVYNHFQDKETLFRATLAAVAEQVGAANLAAVERITPDGDPRQTLTHAARTLARRCCDEQSRALRTLTYAQLSRFPELLTDVHAVTAGRLGDALADHLARLVIGGQLRHCDPALVAEQFLALLTGPLERRSHLGTRRLAAAEIDAVADQAAETVFRAFAA
ncbi:MULTISPECIES: TetR/AcrR family transcriptional regulator [unclassified Amycolatopsis]|uniref:TetR/AcrR family transcriptional regulator n=1 Tax=unclassified Amycolatopsis TaxID=2618356 RepID=UPI002875D741|nr:MULTISPECIES: TetR/AcrR family transcriptional regulator [unclassified Amycolatopsis]MDS0135795.1 TetR/AcrR family transcriptional regulator [Amycolatopsis sp. 505]MDS0145604.1 TetR/AcrR family transcriptional regulator [Amycolatopsis sp. CM201R]